MAISKHEFPILEHSSDPVALINPAPEGEKFPRLCLMTFFREVLEKFVNDHHGVQVGSYYSEMRDFPVYRVEYRGVELCCVQAVVGAGSAAMLTDYLFGQGVEVLFACGSCGVLEDIPAGDVIIPVRALRDEGASYHYLPPARFIDLDPAPVEAGKRALEARGVPYVTCTAWTTDAFYRETPELVEYRRSEGCGVVEMECATMAAVARFRGKLFGQLLYSGDILADTSNYDGRDFLQNFTARERLFTLSLEALSLLKDAKK